MRFREILSWLNRLVDIVTDWFLILAGGVLVLKAIFVVDVPVARLVIIASGAILSGFGLWYRHRRKRRSR